MSGLICIDFGSSFTKIAVRRDPNDMAVLVGEEKPEGLNFCIPSLVASGRRSPQWLTGEAAMSQVPGDGVTIYDGWKARIFSGGFDAELETVAEKFFIGLRDFLKSQKVNVAGYRTRLCIPKLVRSGAVGSTLLKLAASAGFNQAEIRPYIFEPEANVLGILTRGQNKIWQKDRSVSPQPVIGAMLEPKTSKLFDQLRKNALTGKVRKHSILVVDIGSFTTDFGLVTHHFDEVDDFNKPHVVQMSTPLGVRDLDADVKRRLDPTVVEALQEKSVGEWERMKSQLYQGKPAAIKGRKGAAIQVGSSTSDKQKVLAAIDDFAVRISRAIEDFCRKQVTFADEVILTGGGAMIASLRNAIIQRIVTNGMKRIIDLLDPNEHREIVLQIRTATGWVDDVKGIQARLTKNRQLVRGGSAVGGCSVLIDFPPDSSVLHTDNELADEEDFAEAAIGHEEGRVDESETDDFDSDAEESEESESDDVYSEADEANEDHADGEFDDGDDAGEVAEPAIVATAPAPINLSSVLLELQKVVAQFKLQTTVEAPIQVESNSSAVIVDEQNGWVVVRSRPGKEFETEVERVAELREALTRFFREKPRLRLISVTPLTVDGSTAELLGFYKRIGQRAK